jgi:hypothetical protein
MSWQEAYEKYQVGDSVEALGLCGRNMWVFETGYYCKVVEKDVERFPIPNICIANSKGRKAVLHSENGLNFVVKVNPLQHKKDVEYVKKGKHRKYGIRGDRDDIYKA